MAAQQARREVGRNGARMTLVGIISDTHGLLRKEALDALVGSSLILHAGDIGSPEILDRLGEIAPVIAVRGNVDTEPWALKLPLTQSVQVAGRAIYMIHNRSELASHPAEKGVAAVVFGHSHKPLVDSCGGVIYLNPGSAGPRRFQLPVTVARLAITGSEFRPEIVQLSAVRQVRKSPR
jgi:putative phosphoesterase